MTLLCFAVEFAETLAEDRFQSATAVRDQQADLRAALLTMIKRDAFEPQMKICSRNILSATKAAIALQNDPLAHQQS